MTKGVTITIAGRAFHYGTVDETMRRNTWVFIQFFADRVANNGCCTDRVCRRASAEIAAHFFHEHQPDVDADWFDENLSLENMETIAVEFKRQAMALAVAQGLMGSA